MDRVLVHFQPVGAVFKFVGRAKSVVRQLARLADRHKTRAQLLRQQHAEEKPPCFRPDNLVDIVAVYQLKQRIDGINQCFLVAQQRGDVFKQDSLFWKIGDVADVGLDVHVSG